LLAKEINSYPNLFIGKNILYNMFIMENQSRPDSENNYSIILFSTKENIQSSRCVRPGFHELLYVLSGKITHTINGIEHLQEKGHLTFLRSADTYSTHGSEFEQIIINFPSEFLKQMAKNSRHEKQLAAFIRQNNTPIIRIGPGQQEVFEDSVAFLWRHQHSSFSQLVLMRFLLDFFINYIISAAAPETLCLPQWLRDAIQYVEKNIENDISIAALVFATGMTASHVSRSFKKYFSMSPSDFINKKRLERSCLLLEHSNYPVTNIAGRIGFSSTSYFCSLFKKEYQCSPREFRKKRSR